MPFWKCSNLEAKSATHIKPLKIKKESFKKGQTHLKNQNTSIFRQSASANLNIDLPKSILLAPAKMYA